MQSRRTAAGQKDAIVEWSTIRVFLSIRGSERYFARAAARLNARAT
jgi:hypothetical protein